ncbi:MAG: hypothetical protein EBR82_44945 [Caulobacteraceae bacterium]|nr:hypothetical protein [Caulobacteraceae bacterium]
MSIKYFTYMRMDNGMNMHQNNDDTRPRRNVVKLKVKQPWEVPTGHKEHRDTVMDNRPKRQRTRKDIERGWRNEYDM